MNVGLYIPTFNRPKILEQSIASVLNNTEITPSEVWIIDDGSSATLKRSLLEFSLQSPTNINLLVHGKNLGIGYAFERIYNLIRQSESLDVACIIESDYIWRKDWLKDCLDVFEASPYTIAIAGTDHPDMYDGAKTHGTFPEIMKECFGSDLLAREHLYKPFTLETKNGPIQVQGVSNSCGCMIIHWKRLMERLGSAMSEKEFWGRMDRAFNKGVSHDTRKNASDGHMSSTLSWIGEKAIYIDSLSKEIDFSKNFPMLSICDYSISEHVCGGGVNGLIAPECSTFVHSPKWFPEYLERNPRIVPEGS
jgi:glycosyltransferase involved in cell wall biosynthesis